MLHLRRRRKKMAGKFFTGVVLALAATYATAFTTGFTGARVSQVATKSQTTLSMGLNDPATIGSQGKESYRCVEFLCVGGAREDHTHTCPRETEGWI